MLIIAAAGQLASPAKENRSLHRHPPLLELCLLPANVQQQQSLMATTAPGKGGGAETVQPFSSKRR
jgi:hypothetical protein